MKVLLVSLLALLCLQTPAMADWFARVRCDGPSGQAVYDDYIFTYYGSLVTQQQFVMKDSRSIKHFSDLGVVVPEISRNFPNELIVDLHRDYRDSSILPTTLFNTLGAFNYSVQFNLPEVRIEVTHRKTGGYVGNWIYRECKLVRTELFP